MVAFINCCKAKASVKTKARLLYQSWFFKAMLKYVSEKVGENQVYILSAKYGILGLDDKVEPYNLKLTEQTENDWAEMVFNQAEERGIDLENAIYYCASAYYEPIKRKLETVKGGVVNLTVPFEGLNLQKRSVLITNYYKGEEDLF